MVLHGLTRYCHHLGSINLILTLGERLMMTETLLHPIYAVAPPLSQGVGTALAVNTQDSVYNR